MPSIYEIGGNVRQVWLDNPLPQHPSPHQLYHTAFAKAQRLYNRVAVTGKPWATGTTTIEFPPTVLANGYSEILPMALPPDVGKILLVSSATTGTEYAPLSNTILAPELVNIQDMFTNASLSDASWFGIGASRIGMFKDGYGSWKMRVWGYLPEAVRYDVLYTIGDWAANQSIESSPIFSEHSGLLETDIALALLSKCQWSGDVAKDDSKKLSLLPGLQRDYEEFNREFESYIRSMRVPKVVTISSGVPY